MTERLQKILSARGMASRRKAEELIRAGQVSVNGVTASLGDCADPETDDIRVAGQPLAVREKNVYILLNKPRGYVTTLSDEKGRPDVAGLVADCGERVYPVGRLDMDSEGLLLLTNDGAFANALTHPRHAYSKKYRVTIRGKVDDSALLQLREGIDLDGRMTAPCDVTVLTAEENRTVLEFVLHEGRNRQIRRMCEAVELEVIRLKRIAVGSLKLGMLPVGKWRELTDNEVQKLMRSGALQTEDTKK